MVDQSRSGAPRILVVDDEPDIRDSLAGGLAFEGYDVRTAADGGAALGCIAESVPDLVVLDVGMPYVGGLEVCRRIRSRAIDVPVLLLTARDGTDDRVLGLDAGADDYLVKPFALEELLARLRALLRRRRGPTDPVLRYGGVVLDPTTREATRDGRPLELTRTEFDLLELFLQNPRRVLERQLVLREVWGLDFDSGSNTLDVFVGYLRRKTEADGGTRLLHNVRGVGYVLREPG
ncbi:response regulator transcription factor [Nocardioides sp. SYSU D00038]|uniref:response regulator transcription factor n=1 Tax=Nocardioides sp. SYSU D00038 TaxID=2812554 RepID=UPI0027DBA3A4|nr:response regulator transcription factor [Nocardioides sp. SYSU D00038]